MADLPSTAIRLSTALAQSLRRLKAHKHDQILSAALPAGFDAEEIETKFKKGALTVTLPKRPSAHKPEKKIEVNAAA